MNNYRKENKTAESEFSILQFNLSLVLCLQHMNMVVQISLTNKRKKKGKYKGYNK